MTEEEKLAEEYVKSVIDVDAFDWKIGREIALAYIAGLKAGSQLDKVWQDYDAGEDCYEDLHKGKWVKRGEAKEIIKKMLYEYQRLCLIKKETIAEAGQFIKENT